MQQPKTQLPPIINEDDGELPFFKQDFFSDVALIVSTDEPTDHHHGARRSNNVVILWVQWFCRYRIYIAGWTFRFRELWHKTMCRNPFANQYIVIVQLIRQN